MQQRIDDLQALANAEANGDAGAHHKLLSGIRELQLAVETPIETASRLNFQIVQNICLRVAIEKGILQAVAARDGKHVAAKELADETTADALLIIRTMRVLSAIGVVSEVGENTYAANEVTRHQVQKGSIGAIKHHFDLDMAMAGRLVSYMRREDDNTIYQSTNEAPGCTTLFEYALGTPTLLETMEVNTEQKDAFDSYMASKRPPATMQQWFDVYPAADKLGSAKMTTADETLIVDIGGGPGQELIGLKRRHPQLKGRFILQDLPITVDRIASLPPGIEKMRYDFFTPQPIRGARAYFMRDIMHNWPDSKCHLILSNIAEAMDAKRSVLLIDNYVLPTRGADLRAAEMDILMWLHWSGIQRTVPMWESLLGGAGLEIVKIWPAESGNESVIEVRKRSQEQARSTGLAS